MQKQDWCTGYFYIDAFAGGGRAEVRNISAAGSRNIEDDFTLQLTEEIREEREQLGFLDGSPRVALDTRPPFSKYIFIEKDSVRIDSLNAIANEFAGRRKIEIRPGEASENLQEIVNSSDFNWRRQRAVIFLDPFGMQVRWKTIKEIASTKAMEIFLNFPVGMAIQRLLPRSGKFSHTDRDRLNEYFGSPEWEELLYQERHDLFGNTSLIKVEQSGHRLANWYRNRLNLEFRFTVPPRLIRNTRGGHLYYLMFAGPNATGAEIIDHILSQGETI